MIDKLVSVKEFKDWLNENIASNVVKYTLFSNYIDLLDQPLKLEMFVPCLDGVSFGDMDSFLCSRIEEKGNKVFANCMIKSAKKFREAEKKVLFEGGTLKENELHINGVLCWVGKFKGFKISDLLLQGIDIKLTDNFKQLITG